MTGVEHAFASQPERPTAYPLSTCRRGGTPVGGAAPSSPKRHTGRAAGGGLGAAPLDPLKLSRAAEALKDMGVNASTEAINLRAAAMFSSSQECRTGDIQWTRGELIGVCGAWRALLCRAEGGGQRAVQPPAKLMV